ncbi:MAG: polysaccharide (de)acetylase [Flavobacterium sp.]
MKDSLKRHLINLPGWRTNRKIVVFESDDWGSIRMPSKEIFNLLLQKGIPVDKSKYDSLDCLERHFDLEQLLELLESYKDQKGNSPIFTFNTVMGNPDFDKIKSEEYTAYHHEIFFDSYKRYYQEDLTSLWFYGIDKGLIYPQFHAKEHFNVTMLMRDIVNGNQETKTAFDHGFFGVKTKTSSIYQKSYLAAYYAENLEDLKERVIVLEEGLKLFETIFGFKSETFIACNYLWPKELEFYLNQFGIKGIQGNYTQKCPILSLNGKISLIRNYTGKFNDFNQVYTVRNVKFEPFENQNYDWVSSALKEIEVSFRCKKPAIVTTHRVNYVGGIDPKNAADSKDKLNILLKKILERWPDVEFLSSNELSKTIRNENSHTQ